MSLNQWPLLGDHEFVGLQNYAEAVHDSAFLGSVGVTVLYTVIITPALLVLAFVLALLTQGTDRASRFFRTLYFLPVPVGLASASYLFVWLVQPNVGPIGRVLQLTGVVHQPPVWLAATIPALLVVVGMVVWKVTGLQMILLMAGMQSIPEAMHEAATVDGAGWWRRFLFITLPLLRPTLALVLVFSVAGSLLAFDQFYIITAGGPSNSTLTAVYTIYRTSFVSFHLGYGAAMSILTMLVLAAVSAVQLLLVSQSTEMS
ncbi:MAG: sugar ABC transporter permease [Chloroflexi bacterium]|nr:MAG: sugar ABC transporter permease [Chloroflexota bacterium]